MGSKEELTNWAVKKENKLSYIQTMQASHTPRNYNNQPNLNSNGTFRSNPTPIEPKGDPMDLDASTKKVLGMPRLQSIFLDSIPTDLHSAQTKAQRCIIVYHHSYLG